MGPIRSYFKATLQSRSKSIAGIKCYADGVPGTIYFAKDLYGFDQSKIARDIFGAFTDSDAYDIFAAEEVFSLGPVRARKLK